jgi:hypothetical protein
VPVKDHCAVTKPDGEKLQACRKGNRSDLSKERRGRRIKLNTSWSKKKVRKGAPGAADCSSALWWSVITSARRFCLSSLDAKF